MIEGHIQKPKFLNQFLTAAFTNFCAADFNQSVLPMEVGDKNNFLLVYIGAHCFWPSFLTTPATYLTIL